MQNSFMTTAVAGQYVLPSQKVPEDHLFSPSAFGIPLSVGIGAVENRRLNDSAESTNMNVRNLRWDAKAIRQPRPTIDGGAAVVVGDRESRSHGEGRQSLGTTQAKVTDNGRMYL
jgi:hypothetical protein